MYEIGVVIRITAWKREREKKSLNRFDRFQFNNCPLTSLRPPLPPFPRSRQSCPELCVQRSCVVLYNQFGFSISELTESLRALNGCWLRPSDASWRVKQSAVPPLVAWDQLWQEAQILHTCSLEQVMGNQWTPQGSCYLKLPRIRLESTPPSLLSKQTYLSMALILDVIKLMSVINHGFHVTVSAVKSSINTFCQKSVNSEHLKNGCKLISKTSIFRSCW